MRQHRVRLCTPDKRYSCRGWKLSSRGNLSRGVAAMSHTGFFRKLSSCGLTPNFRHRAVHRLGGACEAIQLLPRDAQAGGPRGVDAPFLQQLRCLHGLLQVVFAASVGIVVVVTRQGVLVRGRWSAVDAEASLRHMPPRPSTGGRSPAASPRLRDQGTPGRRWRCNERSPGIGDVAHDMILGRARRKVAAALAPVDGAPGIERALAMAELTAFSRAASRASDMVAQSFLASCGMVRVKRASCTFPYPGNNCPSMPLA